VCGAQASGEGDEQVGQAGAGPRRGFTAEGGKPCASGVGQFFGVAIDREASE
jgi:hypothetical protein